MPLASTLSALPPTLAPPDPNAPDAPLAPDLRAKLDGVVDSARAAVSAFRDLGQPQVDRIVGAMVVAGLEAAVDLAELATAESGFGVFEDKVIKKLCHEQACIWR